jgi:UDP-N-acetylmuramoyl-tripeptide--D-alanyl-D-alanine ligase
MTALWTSSAIAQATGGAASGDWHVTSADIDSRTIEAGGLFIALKGEATDGHRFLSSAFARGAAAALVSDVSALENPTQPHVLVKDTFVAMQALAAASRDRSTAAIAAVTGSAGKTSVKEATRLALERYRPGAVHASVLSYNNHVGVPLTLVRMAPETKFAVLEMGMNHAGELTDLARQGRPHVAAITTVASAHLEFFKNEEAIADAKAEIFSGLTPGGTAILPADNRHYARLRAAAEKSPAGKILTFGMDSASADVRVEKLVMHANCSCLTARVQDEILTFKINQPGKHWVSNALCVISIVQALGGDLGLAGLALADLHGLDGRGRRTSVATGDGGKALLLDESYNANPASVAAALNVLGGFETRGRGRRVAVLADMKELGETSASLHAGLAGHVIGAGVQLLITVGEKMAHLADALDKQLEIHHANSADEALALVQSLLRTDDIILIKGSNSMGLKKVVQGLPAATEIAA